MSRRIVARVDGPEGSGLNAVVRRDSEWDEFVVTFYRNGAAVPLANYYTDDKADALGTAKADMEHAHGLALEAQQ